MILQIVMNFYANNNLIKKEFKSFLLDWKGEEQWKVRGYGYPYIEYDFRSNRLKFEFTEASSGNSILKLNLEYFSAEPNLERKTVILVYQNDFFEISIVFQNIEICTKFLTILQNYINLSKVIRKQNGHYIIRKYVINS